MKYVLLLLAFAAIVLGPSCVKENEKVVACFSMPNDTVAVGSEVEFVNCSQFADSHMWYFPGAETTTELNPRRSFPSVGRFSITLKVYRQPDIGDSVAYYLVVRDTVAAKSN